jgi:hypothetical protein
MPISRRTTLGLSALAAVGALSACSTRPPPPDASGWQPMRLPGKSPTRYQPAFHDGRWAVEAWADRSVSLWRRRLDLPAERVAEVAFSWWAPALVAGASVTDASRDDAVARVVFGFEGDRSRLSARARAQFELAQLLTGEEPPYATLMYVFDSEAPVGTVATSTRSERIRKWVLDSGPEALGRWRDHRRDLAADFAQAFGEPPGPLRSVAFMTDGDNTQQQVRAWYGPVTV